LVLDLAHPRRAEAERLIKRVYRECFRAAIGVDFPVLIGVADASGAIVAAAGCRLAKVGPLFLERYLDEPIERALARLAGANVERADIAEIGALATTGDGAAIALFAALARHLHQEGAVYAAATATRRLRRAFRAFGFGAREIAAADPARLAEHAKAWGDYCDQEPIVVAGRVEAGCARFQRGAGAGACA
jgi:hypothetical protein